MKTATTRAALAYLAATGLGVGTWAFGFPASFHSSFPGLGRTWVSVDGPFNEHLVRDTGGTYLMMGVLAGLGLLRPREVSPFAIGLTTLVFNVAHFAYHLAHLGMYGPADQVLNVVALVTGVLCSAWLTTPRATLT